MNWTKLLRDLALAGCTQADIAAFCCVAQSTVSDLSRGATKAPGFDFGSKLIEMARKHLPPEMTGGEGAPDSTAASEAQHAA